ncbi:hypothetical protein BDZ91DRAFT_616684, partial [Kalaharituber pfeilii]
QLYISTSTNPYFNLALEHQIFTRRDDNPRAAVFYINSPCVVIGRNQNPWVEVNVPLLHSPPLSPLPATPTGASGGEANTKIPVLRRCSGGGTVFHDLGNLNWSFIVPVPPPFTRDTHAEMVVQALLGLKCAGVRVNGRHDIIQAQIRRRTPLNGGERNQELLGEIQGQLEGEVEFKISGSAYKLTRTTALHHGTLLLSAALDEGKRWIRSTAREWIRGRGVGSVRSPVANLVGEVGSVGEVVERIGEMWGGGESVAWCFVDEEDSAKVQEVKEGMEELHREEWRWGQTPRFTFAVPVVNKVVKENATEPLPPGIHVVADRGVITEVEFNCSEGGR